MMVKNGLSFLALLRAICPSFVTLWDGGWASDVVRGSGWYLASVVSHGHLASVADWDDDPVSCVLGPFETEPWKMDSEMGLRFSGDESPLGTTAANHSNCLSPLESAWYSVLGGASTH